MKNKIIQTAAYLLFALSLLSACTQRPSLGMPVNPVAKYTATVPEEANPAGVTTPTETITPMTLFLANPLPGNLLPDQFLENVILSDSEGASLWFGFALDDPVGSLLHTAEWIYAPSPIYMATWVTFSGSVSVAL